MYTSIAYPTWDSCLNNGEYVELNLNGRKGFLLRTSDSGRMHLIMEGFRLTGNTPDYDTIDFFKSLAGWGSLGGWRFPGTYEEKTIRENMEWFFDDNHESGANLSNTTLADSAVTSSILVDSIVERKDFVLKGYTDTLYTGLRSYHSSHTTTMNTPIAPMKEGAYRIGVELEIEAKSRSKREIINNLKSNWFMQETDGSLSSDRGIEIVTIPLLPKDAMSSDTWEPLIEFLKPIAESYSRSNCGLHIHIGREALGKDEEDRQATLGKLLFLYYEHLKPTSWNTKVFGRRETYNEQRFHCKESEAVKILGMDLMSEKKIRDKVDKGLKETAGITRYYDINVQNANTIEFRKGKGSICTERIIAIITYCDLMIRYCRKRDWMALGADDFLSYIRKNAPKSSPLYRYLPTSGEEE